MSEQLARRTKLFYGVGDIGLSLTSTVIGAYFALSHPLDRAQHRQVCRALEARRTGR